MAEIRRGRHVVFDLQVHLVFVTKYRRGVLSARALEVVEQSCRKVCADFSCALLEFNGEDDHVHLLIAYPPKVALSRLVNSLKGVSSRQVRAAGFPEVRAKLWGKHLWSPSYFAGSAGGAPLETLKRYIQNQRRPIDGDSPPP
jgi:putative transposase